MQSNVVPTLHSPLSLHPNLHHLDFVVLGWVLCFVEVEVGDQPILASNKKQTILWRLVDLHVDLHLGTPWVRVPNQTVKEKNDGSEHKLARPNGSFEFMRKFSMFVGNLLTECENCSW